MASTALGGPSAGSSAASRADPVAAPAAVARAELARRSCRLLAAAGHRLGSGRPRSLARSALRSPRQVARNWCMSRTSSEQIGGASGPAGVGPSAAPETTKPSVVLRHGAAVDLEEGQLVAPGQEPQPRGGDALVADGAAEPVREREAGGPADPSGVSVPGRARPTPPADRACPGYPPGVSSMAMTDSPDCPRAASTRDRRRPLPPQLHPATRRSSSAGSRASKARFAASAG